MTLYDTLPPTAEYTFFSNVYKIFTKQSIFSAIKTIQLKELKILKELQGMFYNQNEIKLEIKTERYLQNPQIFEN